MEVRFVPDEVRMAGMSTAELRSHFLVDGLFCPGEVHLVYTDLDRAVIGGIVPLSESLELPGDRELASEYFAERREIGIINLGATGSVTVDGVASPLQNRDGLYIGRGCRDIQFSSADASNPARFYLVSYPAHATFPTCPIRPDEAETAHLGTPEDANERVLRRYIHLDGVRSCQLVMGFTEMLEGSVWNTMPPHTHSRRTEIYLYFEVGADAAVMHLMGSAQETRHLVVRNGQAVLSPPWSIHCGVGTRSYAFVWAMGGENQVFADMDPVPVKEIK